jgi:hypothetical protein
MAQATRMKRAAQRQLWLFAAVVALLLAAWWQIRSDKAAAPGTLLPIAPDQITRVTLTVGNASTEHYVKRGDHWYSDSPAPTRTDDKHLAELLRIASAPVQSWRPVSNYNLAKIGLAPPQAKLKLDDETADFGAMTAIGHNVYVQVGERVGIVSLRYMPRSAQSTSIQAQ